MDEETLAKIESVVLPEYTIDEIYAALKRIKNSALFLAQDRNGSWWLYVTPVNYPPVWIGDAFSTNHYVISSLRNAVYDRVCVRAPEPEKSLTKLLP